MAGVCVRERSQLNTRDRTDVWCFGTATTRVQDRERCRLTSVAFLRSFERREIGQTPYDLNLTVQRLKQHQNSVNRNHLTCSCRGGGKRKKIRGDDRKGVGVLKCRNVQNRTPTLILLA